MELRLRLDDYDFNSHDLPGRDPVLGAFRPRAPDFNSRDCADRDSFLACIWAAISHFNSRDPTSRDGNMQRISGLFVISIHATQRAAIISMVAPINLF